MSRTVLVTGARAPVALHWCRLFAAAGWRVIAADSLNHPITRFSRLVSSFERLPYPKQDPTAFAARVSAVVDRFEVDLILPTCEEIFHLAAAAPGQPWQDRLFAPPLETLLKLHDKAAFNALVPEPFAPDFRRLESREDVAELGDKHWVLKPCFSRFGTQVLVRPTPEQRLCLNPTPSQPWIAQEYLPGQEVCCSAIAAQGLVVALQVYRPRLRLRNGQGAAVVFESVEAKITEEIRPFVEALAGAQGLTGQFSFDLRRAKDGQFKALECNPRSTSGFHFFGPESGLAAAVSDGASAPATALPGTVMGEHAPALLVGGWKGFIPKLQSLSAWPGDRISPLAQARAFWEIMSIARQNRCSLEEATTLDISWDHSSTV